MAPGDRARLLRRFADQVDAHLEELAQLEVANSGHTIGNARWEAGNVRDVLTYYAGAPERLFGRQIPVPGGVDITFKEPLGVVGVIVPWNFPMPIAGWGFAPALAAGNSVVLKPAELTPLTAIRLGQLALEAGLPEHVFSVIPGPGRVVGERFVTHPDVRKVVFTGSTDVGKGVMAGCAAQVKRLTLELGGKSANIVFADADLERAAASAPSSVFDNAGQDCCARSRILVERAAYDRFLELLEPAVKAVRVEDPRLDSSDMGPLISASQRQPSLATSPTTPPWPSKGRVPTARASGFRRPCWRRSVPTRRPSGRRSSARSSRWSPSTTRPTRCVSPTTPSTGCPGRSGPATSGGRSASPAPSSRATCRSTRIPRCGTGRRSAVSSSPGSDGSSARTRRDSFTETKNVFIATEE